MEAVWRKTTRLVLNLGPCLAGELYARAERESVSPELARNLITSEFLLKRSSEEMQAEVAAGVVATTMTEEELEDCINEALEQVLAEMPAQETRFGISIHVPPECAVGA